MEIQKDAIVQPILLVDSQTKSGCPLANGQLLRWRRRQVRGICLGNRCCGFAGSLGLLVEQLDTDVVGVERSARRCLGLVVFGWSWRRWQRFLLRLDRHDCGDQTMPCLFDGSLASGRFCPVGVPGFLCALLRSLPPDARRPSTGPAPPGGGRESRGGSPSRPPSGHRGRSALLVLGGFGRLAQRRPGPVPGMDWEDTSCVCCLGTRVEPAGRRWATIQT